MGRPWRDRARVVFQNTSLSAVINPAGWSVWSTSDVNTEFVYFREFKNTGTGASGTRVCPHVQPCTIACRFANSVTFYLIGRVFQFLGRSRTHYNVVWIFVHQLGGYFIFVIGFGVNDINNAVAVVSYTQLRRSITCCIKIFPPYKTQSPIDCTLG